MVRKLKEAAPWLLPFLLSFFPVAMIFFQENWKIQFEQDREKEIWQEKVLARIEEFKASYKFDQQVQHMVAAMQEEIRANLKNEKTRILSGNFLVKAFERNIPGFYRPPGTLIYGFSLDARGKSKILTGKGLGSEKGRFIIRILGEILTNEKPTTSQKKSITKKLKQLFGNNVSYELFNHQRKGKVVKALFEDKKTMLAWNGITVKNRHIGGFLIVFPGDPDKQKALDYALINHVWKVEKVDIGLSQNDCVPLLVPIESATASFQLRFLEKFSRFPGVAKVVNLIRGGKPYDQIASLSILTRPNPDAFLFRSLISSELPFELWIMKPLTAQNQRTSMSAVLGGIWFSFWVVIFSKLFFSPKPLSFNMKKWLVSFILLVGGIPLGVFFLIDSYMIEQSINRRENEAIHTAQEILREIDSNSMGLLSRFSTLCQKAMNDPNLKKAFCSENPNIEQQQIKECFSRFEKENIPLDSIFVFQFGKKEVILSANPDKTVQQRDNALKFGLPTVYSILELLEPERFTGSTMHLDRAQKNVVTGFRFIAEKTVFMDLFLFGRKGEKNEIGNQQIFQFHEFIADENQAKAAVFFRAEAFVANLTYTRQAVSSFARKYPDWNFALATEVPDGRKVLFFGKDKPRIDPLRKTVDITANIRANQVDRKKDFAVVGHSCTRMKDIFLAITVSFEKIFANAGKEFRLLLAITLSSFLVMLVLGFAIAHHFLWPLGSIEEGIKELLHNNLDIQLKLDRDDDLGDVAAAFDQMMTGLKERHELGRFVSETLNVTVESTDSLPRDPELKNGVVLATDIRSFTTISETYPASQVVEMLNVHLDLMSGEIRKQGGMIDKFIGDAIVAVFLGDSLSEASKKAVEAAKGMMRQHLYINEERNKHGVFPYFMGVGIEGGEILVGTYGTLDRSEFTVIGDPRAGSEELEAKSKAGKYSKIVVSKLIAGMCPDITFVPLADTGDFEVKEL